MVLPTRTPETPLPKPRTVQGAFDGLALDVEDARLEEHLDFRFHPGLPPWITVGISLMMPKRRATSV